MQTVQSKPLFTTLSSEEAANVNGAWGGYYYAPSWRCYPVSWGGGSSSGWSSSPSVNQTVNVNVQIED